MVTSGTHVNGGCCFDYGNAETNSHDTGNGHMDAINFGTECWFSPCSGSGPWVQADLENGLFAGGNGSNTNNTATSQRVRHRPGQEQRHHDLRASRAATRSRAA